VTRIRLALELLGLAFYLAAQPPLVFLYALGSSLEGVVPAAYWTAIALGYASHLALAFLRPVRSVRVPARQAFDAWVATAPVALALAAALVAARWPLAFESWDGHGLGASGGEVNAALFPWMHAALWVAAAAFIATRQRD
jgi:hypothetical protein